GGLDNASVARRNWSRNLSSVSTASFCVSSSVLSSRSPSVRFSRFVATALPLLSLHELRPDRQLGRRERQGGARRCLFDAFQLEQDPAGLHDRDPPFRIPLALPHPRLGGLLGDRLVGEQPDPHLAA